MAVRKFSDEQVVEIFRIYASASASHTQLAYLLKVSPKTIRRLIRRETYQHVDVPGELLAAADHRRKLGLDQEPNVEEPVSGGSSGPQSPPDVPGRDEVSTYASGTSVPRNSTGGDSREPDQGTSTTPQPPSWSPRAEVGIEELEREGLLPYGTTLRPGHRGRRASDMVGEDVNTAPTESDEMSADFSDQEPSKALPRVPTTESDEPTPRGSEGWVSSAVDQIGGRRIRHYRPPVPPQVRPDGDRAAGNSQPKHTTKPEAREKSPSQRLNRPMVRVSSRQAGQTERPARSYVRRIVRTPRRVAESILDHIDQFVSVAKSESFAGRVLSYVLAMTSALSSIDLLIDLGIYQLASPIGALVSRYVQLIQDLHQVLFGWIAFELPGIPWTVEVDDTESTTLSLLAIVVSIRYRAKHAAQPKHPDDSYILSRLLNPERTGLFGVLQVLSSVARRLIPWYVFGAIASGIYSIFGLLMGLFGNLFRTTIGNYSSTRKQFARLYAIQTAALIVLTLLADAIWSAVLAGA